MQDYKRILGGLNWYKQGIRYWLRKDYEVIQELQVKYPVDFLCQIMDFNRSSFYKWRKLRGTHNRYEKNRIPLTEFLLEAHEAYPSHGYHRLERDVFR